MICPVSHSCSRTWVLCVWPCSQNTSRMVCLVWGAKEPQEVREAGVTGQGHGLVMADLESRKGSGWGWREGRETGREHSAVREVGLAP